MEDEKEKYICFALPMTRLLFSHPQTAVADMFAYGLYRASLSVKSDRFNAYRQVLWCAVNASLNNHLPRHLMQLVVDHMDGEDPNDMKNDYMAKDGSGTIDDSLVDDFINEYGDARDDEVMEWYRFSQTLHTLGLKYRSIPEAMQTGRKYYDLYGYGNVPVGVSIKQMFRYIESLRTEYDRVRCAMYFAIRSLCGNGVAVTTSTAIQWRAMGCRNQQELSVVLRDKKLKSVWVKYATKRQYRTIINDLITSKLIMETRYGNRTCITASIMDESEFVEAVANKIRKINTTRRNKTAAAQRQRLSGMLKERINSS